MATFIQRHKSVHRGIVRITQKEKEQGHSSMIMHGQDCAGHRVPLESAVLAEPVGALGHLCGASDSEGQLHTHLCQGKPENMGRKVHARKVAHILPPHLDPELSRFLALHARKVTHILPPHLAPELSQLLAMHARKVAHSLPPQPCQRKPENMGRQVHARKVAHILPPHLAPEVSQFLLLHASKVTHILPPHLPPEVSQFEESSSQKSCTHLTPASCP